MSQVTIFNQDGSTHATPTSPPTLVGPGVGQPVTIPSRPYTCGHNHTLTGTQTGQNAMGGTGVVPWPDPGPVAEESPDGDDTGPSWDATIGQPEPRAAKYGQA